MSGTRIEVGPGSFTKEGDQSRVLSGSITRAVSAHALTFVSSCSLLTFERNRCGMNGEPDEAKLNTLLEGGWVDLVADTVSMDGDVKEHGLDERVSSLDRLPVAVDCT